MAYYTLLTRYESQWCPQFGDHDRSVVEYERRDMLDSFNPGGLLARDIKIIKTPTAHQYQINAAIATLNTNNS